MKSSGKPFTLDASSGHVSDLAEGRHGDPFSVLGRHAAPGREVIRCFAPRTLNLWLVDESRPMRRVPGTDLFEYQAEPGEVPQRYEVIRETDRGVRYARHDPYAFDVQLNPDEMAAFNYGEHRYAHRLLGARRHEADGIGGTLFSVWAPNAGRVSVIGDFNDWDGRLHPMRFHADQGIWELFVPDVFEGHYRFEIRNAQTGELHVRSDPFARATEYRPGTASVITEAPRHDWQDQAWEGEKAGGGWHRKPMSVYEVHAGSWRRNEDGSFMGYRRMAEELCAYVKHLGFTHVELLPITEHPLDESWGYQTTGYFSPTSRFGSPDDFRYFVDHFHQNGIGVILDWVPAHFPRDGHALANFDGSALFEYHCGIKAGHPEWGTLVFNYERNEIQSFLISNAIYWLKEFHLDGLRVDAVASMLYLDFSRKDGEWIPNEHGGNENIEAIEFLRRFNEAIGHECPGCVTIAEESTAWPGVTHPTSSGGLGFGLKWNMGWMNDTLEYFKKESVHRKFHQNLLTFGPLYAFDEQFMLPLSHDEVVHLKKSLFSKMPGDDWQQFANLRLLLTYQWVYPGKQLLFMGGEFAQSTEWNSGTALPWERSREYMAEGVSNLVRDLNGLHHDHPAFYEWDTDHRGFEWLNGDDSDQSVIAFARRSESETLTVVLNFTPVVRNDYRIPMLEPGAYWELFNSDGGGYGGSNLLNHEQLHTEPRGMSGREHSLCLTLPPLAGVVLRKA